MANRIRLLEDASATGEYKSLTLPTGLAQVIVSGTFGGATIGLENEHVGNDVPVFDGASTLAITTPKSILINVSYGEKLRATVTGGTGTSVTIDVLEVKQT